VVCRFETNKAGNGASRHARIAKPLQSID